MSQQLEPVVGWRLWIGEGEDLLSWAVDYSWVPGENIAQCLAPHQPRCIKVPGTVCQCGFWAVWSPKWSVTRAVDLSPKGAYVWGLVQGWGTVAIHGTEGFRAERAKVLCLFTDRPWNTVAKPLAKRVALGIFYKEALARSELVVIARRYAVPLLPLRLAADYGLLREFGVPSHQISEALELVWARNGER